MELGDHRPKVQSLRSNGFRISVKGFRVSLFGFQGGFWVFKVFKPDTATCFDLPGFREFRV